MRSDAHRGRRVRLRWARRRSARRRWSDSRWLGSDDRPPHLPVMQISSEPQVVVPHVFPPPPVPADPPLPPAFKPANPPTPSAPPVCTPPRVEITRWRRPACGGRSVRDPRAVVRVGSVADASRTRLLEESRVSGADQRRLQSFRLSCAPIGVPVAGCGYWPPSSGGRAGARIRSLSSNKAIP